MGKYLFVLVGFMLLVNTVLAQKEKTNQKDVAGLIPATFQNMGAMLFRTKPSPLLEESRKGLYRAIWEAGSGIGAQLVSRRHQLMWGIGHTFQQYSISNDDGIFTETFLPWLAGCSVCSFEKATYQNHYVTFPVLYSLVLYNKGKSRYLFSVHAGVSNEFRFKSNLQIRFFDPPPDEPQQLIDLLASYQDSDHLIRYNFGLGFKWRAITPAFGFHFKVDCQTIRSGINSEFVAPAWGVVFQFGMQYKFGYAEFLKK